MTEFFFNNWNSGIEIAILTVVIYYGYLYFRGTLGAKVLTGLLILFLTLTLVSQLLDLAVLGWLIERFSIFFVVALVVIFQPELRRALAELGSHHIFSGPASKSASLEELTEAVFELAHKQFGSLIAIERETSLEHFCESGSILDAKLSQQLLMTIFHPKTALHDGGVILRDETIRAAACIFPVSQKEDLDRNLGLRHRAGLGLTEESDAIAIVVSEETGHVSICYEGKITRDLDQANFKKRLNQILLLEKYENTPSQQLEGKGPVSGPRDGNLVPGKKES